jgi:large subunit ribosomal protein L24
MAFSIDIRKNDIVQVMVGRSKGSSGHPTRGRVLEVEPKKQRLFVEHVNMVKRHMRPNPAKQIRGGILEKEGPIHVSNVALVCSECGPTRIQHRETAGGGKVRVCAKCEKSLDK